ncbi:MAG TPA: hypothetical protein VF730_18555 [Terracidiphilus sp.]
MGSNILSSWKEISAYAGFTERTLQRWEQKFGFPVHRPAGKARSSVSALVTEVDAWLHAAPSLPQIRQTLDRYPGKVPQHFKQPLESGLAFSATDSSAPLSAAAGEPGIAPHVAPDSRTSPEPEEVFVTAVTLMRDLRQERAAMRAHLAMFREELAKTREISAQFRRNMRWPESPLV